MDALKTQLWCWEKGGWKTGLNFFDKILSTFLLMKNWHQDFMLTQCWHRVHDSGNCGKTDTITSGDGETGVDSADTVELGGTLWYSWYGGGAGDK